MRYDHAVIANGILYRTGEEVPEEVEVVASEEPVTTIDNEQVEKPRRGRPKK